MAVETTPGDLPLASKKQELIDSLPEGKEWTNSDTCLVGNLMFLEITGVLEDKVWEDLASSVYFRGSMQDTSESETLYEKAIGYLTLDNITFGVASYSHYKTGVHAIVKGQQVLADLAAANAFVAEADVGRGTMSIQKLLANVEDFSEGYRW